MNSKAPEDQNWFVSRWLLTFLFPLLKQGSSAYRSLTSYPPVPEWMNLDKWYNKLKQEWNKTVEDEDPSFLKAFLKTFMWEQVPVLLGVMYFQLMYFAICIVLIYLVRYFLNPDAPIEEGLILFGAMAFILFSNNIVGNNVLRKSFLTFGIGK